MIGLDSDAIIELLCKNNELVQLIEGLNEEFCATIINYQEIIFGFNPTNKKQTEEKKIYDSFFEDIIIFNLDKKTCSKSNEIFWNLRGIGKEVGKFDCMIAGILLSNGVNKIITRNKSHFENIPGLDVISY